MAVVKRQLSEADFERFVSGLPYPPNKFQSEILRSIASGEGNILVNALAGSGKTTLLMQCAALLKKMGVAGRDVLFVAFNVKIAKEMNERLPDGFNAINSHKIGNAALRQHGSQGKTKIDWNKWKNICTPIVSRPATGYADDSYKASKMLQDLCSKAMLSNLKLVNLTADERVVLPDKLMDIAAHFSILTEENHGMVEDLIHYVPEAMEKAKQIFDTTGEIMFDEMLYWPVAMNMPFPKYQYIFVDECQDLNGLQQQIILRSIKAGGRMVFVGDMKQSIYGFAGADAQSFSRIQKLTDAKVLPLNICYRCPSSHLDMARSIVPEIEAGPTAIEGTIKYMLTELSSEDPLDREKKCVKELPLHLNKGALVLCRLTAPLVSAYFKLIGAYAGKAKADRIPVKILGKKIADELGGIIDKVSKTPGFQYTTITKYLAEYRDAQKEFLKQKDAPISQIQKLEDAVEVLQICVENFTHCASTYGLKDELKDLFGDEKDKGYNQDDYITLLTVHRAKGLEADQVAILMPSKMPLRWKDQQDWEYEQEMNILYVALTRAKKELIVAGMPGSLNVKATKSEDNNHRGFKSIIELPEVEEDIMDALPEPEPEVDEEAIKAEAAILAEKIMTKEKDDVESVIRGKDAHPEEPPAPTDEELSVMESELPEVDVEDVAEIGVAVATQLEQPTNPEYVKAATEFAIAYGDGPDSKPDPLVFPAEPVAWAQFILDHKDRVVVLDTETTTFSSKPECEIVQLAIVDMDGKALFNQRIKPVRGLVSKGAQETHGISDEMLANEKHLIAYLPDIRDTIQDKYIIAFNSPFDEKAMKHAFLNAGIEAIPVAGWQCVMRPYTRHNPNKLYLSGYKAGKGGANWKLIEAVEQQGMTAREDAHDALADVLMTVDLIQSMATDAVDRWTAPQKTPDVVEAQVKEKVEEVVAPEPEVKQPDVLKEKPASAIQQGLFNGIENATEAKSQVADDTPTVQEVVVPAPVAKEKAPSAPEKEFKASGDLKADLKKHKQLVANKRRSVTEVLTDISDVQTIDTLIELLQTRREELTAEKA